MGERNVVILFILFIIGLLCHIFGFVLNEYMDINVDKKSFDLKDKPLVKGTIKKKYALFIAIFSCVFAFSITIIIFKNNILPLIFLALSALLCVLYNIYSKKILYPEFLLSGGILFIFLYGASTISYDFTSLIYIASFVYFFQIIFSDSIEGAIKDIVHDNLVNAKTTAIKMGVKIENGILKITTKFERYAYVLKLIFIGLIVVLFSLQIEYYQDEYLFHILLLILFTFILFRVTYKFIQYQTFNRKKLIKLFGIHEISAFAIFLIALSPTIKEWSIIIFIGSLLWYLLFNLVIYNSLFTPKI